MCFLKRIILVLAFYCSCICTCRAQLFAGDPFAPAKKKSFCNPGIQNSSPGKGVDIGFAHHGGSPIGHDMRPGFAPDYLESLNELKLSVKAPLFLKDRTKVLVGYKHVPEYLDYDFIPEGAFQDPENLFTQVASRRLVRNSFGLYGIHSLDNKHYIGGRLAVTYTGDYTGWINTDSRYAAYNAILAYGIKKSEDFEWGFGLMVNHNARRTLPLPFLVYNRNFNETWGIEASFPQEVQGRLNINKRNLLLFGYSFGSKTYSVDLDHSLTEDPGPYTFNHSEIISGLNWQTNVAPWVWLDLQAGYSFNLSTNLLNDLGEETYRLQTGAAPYFRIGIFASPQ